MMHFSSFSLPSLPSDTSMVSDDLWHMIVVRTIFILCETEWNTSITLLLSANNAQVVSELSLYVEWTINMYNEE